MSNDEVCKFGHIVLRGYDCNCCLHQGGYGPNVSNFNQQREPWWHKNTMPMCWQHCRVQHVKTKSFQTLNKKTICIGYGQPGHGKDKAGAGRLAAWSPLRLSADGHELMIHEVAWHVHLRRERNAKSVAAISSKVLIQSCWKLLVNLRWFDFF